MPSAKHRTKADSDSGIGIDLGIDRCGTLPGRAATLVYNLKQGSP
jgi:hypothetical protein